jgi:hypothetical protein
MNLSTDVIPAQAGTQYTSHQGIALGEAPYGKRVRNTLHAPLSMGDLGARLRGHDVVVGRAAFLSLRRIGDEGRANY